MKRRWGEGRRRREGGGEKREEEEDREKEKEREDMLRVDPKSSILRACATKSFMTIPQLLFLVH